MNITVLGTGNGGTMIAADLSMKGHQVTLCKTSDKLHNDHFESLLQTRKIQVVDLNRTYEVEVEAVTRDLEFAVRGAELIIFYIQSNYHEELISKIAPYLVDGQTLLFEPGALSTCYVLKHCQADLTIIEAESSPIDCRIISPGVVKVLFKNAINPFGVYPRSHSEKANSVLTKLKYNHKLLSSVVEAALHNPNIIVHTVGAIFSIPRIEYSKGDYWMYREVFTPHIWNIVEALDSEKNDVLHALGFNKLAYVDACKERNFPNDDRASKEVFFDYAMNHSPAGPTVPDSRYITEDVPQGLVLLESLGKMVSVETPVCSSLINCASAALLTDFRSIGRTIDSLGRHNIEAVLSN